MATVTSREEEVKLILQKYYHTDIYSDRAIAKNQELFRALIGLLVYHPYLEENDIKRKLIDIFNLHKMDTEELKANLVENENFVDIEDHEKFKERQCDYIFDYTDNVCKNTMKAMNRLKGITN